VEESHYLVHGKKGLSAQTSCMGQQHPYNLLTQKKLQCLIKEKTTTRFRTGRSLASPLQRSIVFPRCRTFYSTARFSRHGWRRKRHSRLLQRTVWCNGPPKGRGRLCHRCSNCSGLWNYFNQKDKTDAWES